jgi:hypothetical protein
LKAKAKAKQTQRKRGKPAPLATVRAMAGVGYSQAVIARHIGVSEPTLRAHYRELLDNATESMCAMVYANLCKTATTKNDNAGVQAAKYILGCRAPGWAERSRVEVENDGGRGLMAILRMIEAKNSPDYVEPDIDAQIAEAKKRPDWDQDAKSTYPRH